MNAKPFLVILAIALFTVMASFSQATQGVILYEFRMDLHRNIPPEREEMKAMIPQFRTDNYELFFNQTERLYKMKPGEEIEVNPGRGGGRMRFQMPGVEIYTGLADGERIAAQEIFGRNYLIVDTLQLGPWRLGSEYMDIAGYRCQMAWYVDTVTGHEITAWFTTELQPFLGPDRYGTLPGTVLALDVNNGERVWVARKVELKPLAEGQLRKPTRGDRMSRTEFDKMMEEQRERMRSRGGFGF